MNITSNNQEKDLSIVIVSWNVCDLLKQALASIYQETNFISFEVIVVDNNSHDGSADMVMNEFPQVVLIRNKYNAGFAKANNQAIKRTTGRYILLLNPDTVILDGNLDHSVGWMDDNVSVGIMGCRLLNPNHTPQASVRQLPTIGAMAMTLLKLHRVFPNAKAIKDYTRADFDYNKTQTVDQVMGAYFMVRRKTLDQIGLLDEGYFIWFEEVDYCARAKEMDWKVAYYPDASIIHYYGQSFRQVLSLRKQVILNNSLLRYYQKHGTMWDRLIVKLLYIPSLIPSLVVSLIIQPFMK
ncbi:MAG: glycosyltransferase family 2 protein [Patescibacteria group bacterium]|jgi:hypothetical protein